MVCMTTRLQCPEREFLLRMTYMEIYNELVHDLLDPSNVNLKIREDKQVRTSLANHRLPWQHVHIPVRALSPSARGVCGGP